MRHHRPLLCLGALAALLLTGCRADGPAPAAEPVAEPVAQTYAATSDDLCSGLELEGDGGLGPLAEAGSSHAADSRGTTDRCVVGRGSTSSERVTVTVEVDVRTDGTAPPFDARQFPLYRSDATEATSASIDGWWDDGVLGTQTLVDGDGLVHGHAASGAVGHDNLKVLVVVAAERSSDPGSHRGAVSRLAERLLADVGQQLRRQASS